jgi:hypothetical protein
MPLIQTNMSVNHKLYIVLFFLVVILNSAVAAKDDYPGGQAHSRPVDLSIETFPKAIEDPENKFWLFKFYAPWCGHW